MESFIYYWVKKNKIMRIISLLTLILFLGLAFASAQTPVQWTATAIKTGKKTFQVKVSGSIAEGWYIYAGKRRPGGIVPVSLQFDADSAVTLDGSMKEEGTTEQKFDPSAGSMVGIYRKEVMFTQTVKVKSKLPRKLTGSIRFMGCDETMCLPPSEDVISVVLR